LLYTFARSTSSAEDFALAEISKLSVGQALDKLRGTDAPASRMTELGGKIDALDKEMQLLRATSRRVERDQRAASTGSDVPEAVVGRAINSKTLWMTIGLVIVILVMAWKWLL
jgi:hypothetical protein